MRTRCPDGFLICGYQNFCSLLKWYGCLAQNMLSCRLAQLVPCCLVVWREGCSIDRASTYFICMDILHSIILYTPEGWHRWLGWRGKEWPRKNKATRPIKAEKQRCAISEREIWFLRNKCYKLKQKCSWLKINWQLGRKSFDKLILFESKGLPLMWFSTDWLKPQHIARQPGAGSNFLCLILNFYSHLLSGEEFLLILLHNSECINKLVSLSRIPKFYPTLKPWTLKVNPKTICGKPWRDGWGDSKFPLRSPNLMGGLIKESYK